MVCDDFLLCFFPLFLFFRTVFFHSDKFVEIDSRSVFGLPTHLSDFVMQASHGFHSAALFVQLSSLKDAILWLVPFSIFLFRPNTSY